MEYIRSFALVVCSDFGEEIDRYQLEYVESPNNLGFEMQFTTMDARPVTYITSMSEKKLDVNFNINFLPPNAYAKSNEFKRFVQRYMNRNIVLEYDDTNEVKNIEGKVKKVGLSELTEWGGLTCAFAFTASTPKYIQKNNTVYVNYSESGKSYPLIYPYGYGETIQKNDEIENTYFEDIPLRVILYGKMNNPQISLQDMDSGEVYSTVRFLNLHIEDGEHVIIDSIRSKVLKSIAGEYSSAYDYISKQANLDTFLYAKGNTKSRIILKQDSSDSGYMSVSYRQYVL